MCDKSSAAIVLAAEVDQLRELVHLLEDRVRVLEEKVGESGFCLVEKEDDTERVTLAAQLPVAPSQAAGSVQSSGYEQQTDQRRDVVLRSIGVWLRDNLAGQRRGVSGRDQLRESSRYYLVLRNYADVYDPVKIYSSFSEASRGPGW